MLRGPSEEVYFTAFFPPLRAEPLLALPPSWPLGDATDFVARTHHPSPDTFRPSMPVGACSRGPAADRPQPAVTEVADLCSGPTRPEMDTEIQIGPTGRQLLPLAVV